MNRTAIVRKLTDIGQADLADKYVCYYLARWKFFLSNGEDFDVARSAVYAAIEVIQQAETVAKNWLSENE